SPVESALAVLQPAVVAAITSIAAHRILACFIWRPSLWVMVRVLQMRSVLDRIINDFRHPLNRGRTGKPHPGNDDRWRARNTDRLRRHGILGQRREGRRVT